MYYYTTKDVRLIIFIYTFVKSFTTFYSPLNYSISIKKNNKIMKSLKFYSFAKTVTILFSSYMIVLVAILIIMHKY